MRFQSLDGWRGIAALLVSLYHLDFLNHLYDWQFLRNSYLFVDFFFVLSGFVITHAYHNKLNSIQDSYQFIYRRIARLLPLHIFVLLLFVLLELLKLILIQSGNWNNDTAPFTEEYSLSSLASNLFLLQSMGIHDKLTWNYPSWSISVEFYTYLVFAIVAGISLKFKNLLKIQYAILITISLFILYINTESLSFATYDYGIFRCISGFFLGSISYKLFSAKKSAIIPNATIIEMVLIAGIYFFIVQYGNHKLSILAPFLFALTVTIFAYEQGAISRLLKIKIIQSLGKWSYSIYMLHALIILIIGRSFNVFESKLDLNLVTKHATDNNSITELIYFSSPYLMDLLTVLYLVVLVTVASFTHKYIEIKGSRLFK